MILFVFRWVLGFELKIKFYTFWNRNQKMFKIFDTQKMLGLKNLRKIYENFLSVKKVRNFKHLLISIYLLGQDPNP
jgi:hypothetical protein